MGSTSRTCKSDKSWGGMEMICTATPDFCPQLSPPANGYISGSCERTVSEVCGVFTCNAGYTRSSGSTSRTCQSDRGWSGTDVVCSLDGNYCTQLSAPANGAITSSCAAKGTLGDVCGDFVCNAGYSLSGSITRTCQLGGVWNGSIAACTPVSNYCPPSPTPSSNMVTGECSRAIDGGCLYSCSDGYEIVGGSGRLTCSAGPTWTGTRGTCEPIDSYCSPLLPPHNGMVAVPSLSINSEATYTCNLGYVRTAGSATRTCNAESSSSGVWSGTVTICTEDNGYCEIASVPPAPPHFELYSCDGSQGGECVFECEQGYSLAGNDHFTCESDRSWSGALGSCTLQPNYCTPLAIPGNGTRGACSGTLGEVCGPVTCNAGYEVSGTASRTCNSGGLWSGTTATCDAIEFYCPSVTPPSHAVLDTCARSIGATCSYSCSSGYVPDQAQTMTCLAGPAWSNSFGSCIPDPEFCPLLTAPGNGSLAACDQSLNTVCGPADCNPGYDLLGDAVRTCVDGEDAGGTWTGTAPSCALDSEFCPVLPAPSSGFIAACDRSVGGQCTFVCEPGYEPSGSLVATCTSASTWDVSLGSCTKIFGYCSGLPPPDNGGALACGNSLGDSCSFTCNTGYLLTGSTERTCLAGTTSSGVWSGTEPACIIDGVYCGEGPPAPGNGTRGDCSRVIGGACTYACDPGYTLSGDDQLTCAVGPSWVGTLPSCSLTNGYCPISALVDGVAPPCHGRLGETCGPYVCNPGFTHYGGASLTCEFGGVWSDVVPFCSAASSSNSRVNSLNTVTFSADMTPGWSFEVQVFDANNTVITSAVDRIVVRPAGTAITLTSSSLATVDWDATLSVWKGAVTLRRAGVFNLNVFLNLNPIASLAGSTLFQIQVEPGLPAAANSVADGPGLAIGSSVIQGQPVLFYISPHDAYNNIIHISDVQAEALSGALGFEAVLESETVDDPLVEFVPELSGSVANGKLAFRYTAATGGLYVLSITRGGVAIKDSPWLVEVTAVCPAGTRAVQATGPCVECPVNTYAAAGSFECSECPEFTGAPARSESAANCTCLGGDWHPSAEAGAACQQYPPFATCSGGTGYPIANPGYFETAPNSGAFVACPRTKACLGAGACADGHTGYMCTVCKPGYFSNTASECERCPRGSSAIFVVLFVLVLVVATAMACGLVWRTLRVVAAQARTGNSGEASGELIRLFRTNMMPASLSMILVAFQVVGIFADANFAWSDASRASLRLFNVFNIDVDMFATECALQSFHAKYAFSIVLPLFVILVTLAFIVGFKVVGARHVTRLAPLATVSIRTLVDAVLFALAPLLYIPVSRTALIMFDCTRLADGSYVLDSNPGIKCFNSQWWELLPVGLVALVVYVLGLPIYFGIALLRRRHILFLPSVTVRFGTLYRLYRKAYYWGEVANLVKRLVIVILAVFFSSRQLLQISLMLALLTTSLVVVSRYEPYYFPLYNAVDTRLSVMLIIILMIGTGSYAERDAASSDSTFFVLTLVAIIALVLVSVHALAVDVWLIYRERHGKSD
ncbi:uncharacterized protein AMSG_09607 [Thecamonas trahens ATCC 50062]|uniref:Sushi domain-containing protein n=1 Tax=Thecamonas trahens ATCC 50062 TaxID=461836 RepID=A0A0L0DPL2_THETB|nr:hypothetical protein AMSG_09607 [Thecamonas trahens ATCC 50062]KNC53961.1 hypothetical protein AMSG_09607 [Thecamonas trahens ATCC 50062]|eukprot:XP_013754163.1 hypothetical protein AMSG_09607 [Thecamonas trahens ATCC 50062]